MLAQVELPTWVVTAGGILTAVALLFGGAAFVRGISIKASVVALQSTLEAVTQGNEELRKVNDDLRKELTEAKTAHARLEGQMQILTSHLGEQIAQAVVRALPDAARDPGARTRSTDVPPTGRKRT